MTQEHRTAEEVRREAKQSNKARLEQQWWYSWIMHYPTLPVPVRQYKFHPIRKWLFDFAFVEEKIAVEIDGGAFMRGGHNTAIGQQKDYEKARAAVRLGWRVMRFNTKDLDDVDACTQEVAELLTDARDVT